MHNQGVFVFKENKIPSPLTMNFTSAICACCKYNKRISQPNRGTAIAGEGILWCNSCGEDRHRENEIKSCSKHFQLAGRAGAYILDVYWCVDGTVKFSLDKCLMLAQMDRQAFIT